MLVLKQCWMHCTQAVNKITPNALRNKFTPEEFNPVILSSPFLIWIFVRSQDLLQPSEIRHVQQFSMYRWVLSVIHSLMFVGFSPMIVRRKFRSQTSDNMDRWKAEVGRVREEKSEMEKIKEGESQKREHAGARKGRKVAIHSVSPMIWGSWGSKSNLAKAAGAEPAGQMRDEKLHAVVARSTFPSQKGKKNTVSDHFWKLRCWKSARRCGAKHICK